MKILLIILGVLLLLVVFVLHKIIGWKNLWNRPRPKFKVPTKKLAPKEWDAQKVTVGWVGHSTVLINLYGYTILTDPVFSKRVGMHLGWTNLGIKRHTAPAIDLEDLGRVDLILLSHAHMDHMDICSLKRLAHPETEVVTAKGTSHLLKRMPFRKVYELGDQEQISLDMGVTITAVPVKHWGNRYPWNISYGCTGYLIERNNTRIFFPGDTAYTPQFRELRKAGAIDLVLMPIGAYHPQSFQWAHCSPEQAWDMFKDIGAKWLVPIHWNTFVLTYEPVEEPLVRLLKAAGEESERIVIREQGDTFVFAKE